VDIEDLEGDAALEEASEDATMALAKESTVTVDWNDGTELDVKRRF